MGTKHSKNNKDKTQKNNISKHNIKKDVNKPHKKSKNMLIKCIYEVKDYNEVQIINNQNKNYINEEIEQKIKILNGNKIEKLIFKKKFNNLGKNTVIFICEEKLTKMDFMFYQCYSLKRVEFISFDTSQVTSMTGMFSECEKLEYIDLTGFNTSNVTEMTMMFNECYELKEIKGINNFNTSKVEFMTSMFTFCRELEYLDLSNFYIKNTSYFQTMFAGCLKLKEIKGINNFDVDYLKQNLIITDSMFEDCDELENCQELISVIKNKKPFEEYLRELDAKAEKLIDFIQDEQDKNSEQNIQMLIKCIYEVKDNNEIQIINNQNGDYKNEEIEQKIKILNGNEKEQLTFKKKFNNLGKNIIIFICEKKLKNMDVIFNQCSSLKQIEFINFDTSRVKSMNGMFFGCKELEYVDLSCFDTSNVTDMKFMFHECHKLKEIKGIDNFNTENVEYLLGMVMNATN